jgi:hypothetical protein
VQEFSDYLVGVLATHRVHHRLPTPDVERYV